MRKSQEDEGIMGQISHPSSSNVQQDAEKELIQAISNEMKVNLVKDYPLQVETSVEVDGYCVEPPIMCEAWANLGPTKGAQDSKVMMDALKMMFIEKRLGKQFKKILVFAGEDARKPFYDSDRWQAKCLQMFDIKCEVGKLRTEILERLREAQNRQSNFFKMENID
jgi:hypothetical protein